MMSKFGAWVLFMSLLTAARSTRAAIHCVGDCDSNDAVTIDELVRGVRIALGREPVSACRALDRDGDGVVAIAEVIAAVENELEGCHATPTASITPSYSPTPKPGECGEVCDGRFCGQQKCGERPFFGPVFGTALCIGETQNGCACKLHECDQCGNGFVDGDEECDVQDSLGGMGCAVNCTNEREVVGRISNLVLEQYRDRSFVGDMALYVGKVRNPPPPPCVPAVVRSFRGEPSCVAETCLCVEAQVDPDSYGVGNAGLAKLGCSGTLQDIEGIATLEVWTAEAGGYGNDHLPCTEDDPGRDGAQRLVTAPFHAAIDLCGGSCAGRGAGGGASP